MREREGENASGARRLVGCTRKIVTFPTVRCYGSTVLFMHEHATANIIKVSVHGSLRYFVAIPCDPFSALTIIDEDEENRER